MSHVAHHLIVPSNMPEPLYIQLRRLAECEFVSRTVDYLDLGKVMIDLDANNKIIGVEILEYLDVKLDAMRVIDSYGVIKGKNMSNIVFAAERIAREAHKEQKRKWGNQEPYIVHPEWCATKAREIGADEVVQAAMYCHDVFEDIAIPTNTVELWEHRIKEECGQEVVDLCWELTNISDTKEWMAENPNPKRSEKWTVNLAHIRQISDRAKRCKMIDRLANILTMDGAPYRMKQKYVPESKELLAACRYADEDLGLELEEAIKALEKGL